MKRLVYISCMLLSLSILSCSKDSDNSNNNSTTEDTFNGDTVKVMSYNIYSGQKKGIPAIAAVINEVDPDVVGLQEVESESNLVTFDVVHKFIELTNMKYAYFAITYNMNPGDYGNLILSKYPISDKKTYQLDVLTEDGAYPRALGIVKVNKKGKEFYFADTHLDHLYENNRLRQVENILEHIKDITAPIILSGDFNTHPDEAPITSITQKFTLGCIDSYCGYTAPAPQPSYTIDYLMYTPKESVRVADYQVYYDAYSESDHFPVVGTFILKK